MATTSMLIVMGPLLLAVALSSSTANAEAVKPVDEAPRPGRVFRDCGDCPTMVVVPAGRFTLGSNEPGNERPAHEVVIGAPFAVGRFAVTIAEWDACVTARGCTHRPPQEGRSRDQPVLGVSWEDITGEYLPWLRRMTGKSYRLPSEAEWVYAARAGGAGNDAANAFGLRDMGQSAWEWVEDCYHKSYVGAPADGTAWTTDCEKATYGPGTLRVVRGVERNIVPQNLTARGILPPLVAVGRNTGASGFRGKTRGFRVAL
jgi:formylglycine-generating enzyme required for sulfatase activity